MRELSAPATVSQADDSCRLPKPAISESSLTTKLVSCLPRTLRKRIQQGQENQQERITGVVLCACGAAIVLLANVILTVIAIVISYSNHREQEFASAMLYQGNCSVSKSWARGLNLLINVLSTLILASSNYCMQCLSSPSREEVDNAHSRGNWLDIGVPSLKNLLYIGLKRSTLWLVLLVTSLPIHLMSVRSTVPCYSHFSVLTLRQIQLCRVFFTGHQ